MDQSKARVCRSIEKRIQIQTLAFGFIRAEMGLVKALKSRLEVL